MRSETLFSIMATALFIAGALAPAAEANDSVVAAGPNNSACKDLKFKWLRDACYKAGALAKKLLPAGKLADPILEAAENDAQQVANDAGALTGGLVGPAVPDATLAYNKCVEDNSGWDPRLSACRLMWEALSAQDRALASVNFCTYKDNSWTWVSCVEAARATVVVAASNDAGNVVETVKAPVEPSPPVEAAWIAIAVACVRDDQQASVWVNTDGSTWDTHLKIGQAVVRSGVSGEGGACFTPTNIADCKKLKGHWAPEGGVIQCFSKDGQKLTEQMNCLDTKANPSAWFNEEDQLCHKSRRIACTYYHLEYVERSGLCGAPLPSSANPPTQPPINPTPTVGPGCPAIADGQCFTPVDNKKACEAAGGIYVSVTVGCYDVGAGAIPKGMEQMYIDLLDAQAKALEAKHQLALTEQMYKLQRAKVEAHELELKALDAAHDLRMAEARAKAEADIADADAAIETYKAILKESGYVVTFMKERLALTRYSGTVSPSSSLGIMKSTYEGFTQADIHISLPKGIPTPVSQSGTNAWAVNIPVTVTFPKDTYRDVDITYVGGKLLYSLSINGGGRYMSGEIPLDHTTTGNAKETVNFNIRLAFSKAQGNYDLILNTEVTFTEEYVFPSGAEDELEDMSRRGPQIRRTFYTTANILKEAPAEILSLEMVEGVGQVIDGAAPVGAVDLLNRLEAIDSQVQSKTKGFDAITGLGARYIVPALPYAGGAAVLAIGYVKGALDFLPFIAKYRAQRLAAKAAKAGLAGFGSI